MKKRIIRETPDPIDKYVGSRVRARRVGLRMSQSKLGQVVGVTFQQVQKYENGANRIGASNLYKFAHAMDVEISFFYEGMPSAAYRPKAKGRPAKATEMAERNPLGSREAIVLMHNYFRIPNETVRKQLFQFVKALASLKSVR